MSSVNEKASKDLRSARAAFHKLSDAFAEFQSHSRSIISFGQQWRRLEVSFAAIHSSLENRVKEIESEEREIGVVKNRFLNLSKDVELRQKKLEMEERSLSERIRGVEIKEKNLKDFCETLNIKKRAIDERLKEVELREKRISEGFEKAASGKSEELNGREKGLNVLCEAVKMKEGELNTRLLMLEYNEVNIEAKRKDLELKESGIKEFYNVIEVLGKEMTEKGVMLLSKANEVIEKREMLVSKEMEMTEKGEMLVSKEKEMDERSQVLEVREKRVEEREGDVELKEKEMDERSRVLEAKEKQVEEREGDVELKEKEMKEHSRALEGKERRVEEREGDVELKEKEMEEHSRVLEAKEKWIEEREGDMELKENELESRQRWLECCEIGVDKERQSFGLEEKWLSDRSRVVEERENELRKREEACCEREKVLKEIVDEIKSRVVIGKDEELNKFHEEVKLKGGEMDRMLPVLEGKESNLEEVKKNYELIETQMDELYKVLELKEQEMVEKSELLVVKENMLGLGEEVVKEQKKELDEHSRDWVVEKQSDGHCDSLLSKIGGGYNIHSLCKNMDAYGIRSHLIKHFIENQMSTLNENLMNGLKCAPDPAKLVFIVCQSFHTEYSDKGLTIANKNVCIYLLEQFMKLSLPIALDVQDEAILFASSFWNLLKRSGSYTVENSHGFLQFLAAFKIGLLYNPHELLSLFGHFYRGQDVYRHDQQASLCHVLGLSKLIPGVINSLIERKKFLTAIKYTCVFKLECVFPLAPLLESHMDSAEKRVNEKLREGTLKSQRQAVSMELSFLQDVIKCITTFKLESKFSPNFFISRITELELKKEVRKPVALERNNKRSASARSCSLASLKHLQKHPRVGNAHQVNTDD